MAICAVALVKFRDVSLSIPGHACKDVSVLWATEQAGPRARGQYQARHEPPCDARCFSCAVRAPTLSWPTVKGIFNTNKEYPIEESAPSCTRYGAEYPHPGRMLTTI